MWSWNAIALACLLAPGEPSQGWTNWRGPRFDGAIEVGKLPQDFGEDQYLVWKTMLPGPGSATPIVWGSRIFLNTIDLETKKLFALCADRESGRLLWKFEVGEGKLPSGRSRGRENYMTGPSAVTDGATVCFLFGTGDLLGFDLDGELLWRTNVTPDTGRFIINWGYASSPLLRDGILYVQILHRAESYLMAFDSGTGEQLWKHVRENQAKEESQEAYTTPIPFHNEGRTEILVLGADCLTAHDPETGRELWRWCGMNPQNHGHMRQVCNPTVGKDGFIYLTSPQHNPIRAIKVKGDQVWEEWTLSRPTPDVPGLLYYRDRLYSVDGANSRMACLNPETGEVIWQSRLDTPTFIRTSPTGSDGKIFLMDAEGQVVVLAAGDEFKVLARNELGSYPSRSSIVPDNGHLLIRTAAALYCFGEQDEQDEE